VIELPEGYRSRAPSIGDLEAVANVLAADDLADTGEVAFDVAFVRVQWAVPGFDLGTDAWLVEGPGGVVVAFAQARHDDEDLVTSWGVVHPAHRGLGLGSYLLERVEERAGRLLDGPGRLLAAITDTDRRAAALMTSRGLERRSCHRLMQIDLTLPPPTPEPPPGITIRGLDPAHELPVVHTVLTEAFRGDEAYTAEPLEAWIDRVTGSPGYTPEAWWLALEGERPVGALEGAVWDDRGRVSELGVLAGARGRGVGTALLLTAFAWFAERGLPRATLEVDAANPTGALRLYERLGMRAVRGWDLYEKAVNR
jgi:ribosomal protein S18 acetylase RimI-like enzyme